VAILIAARMKSTRLPAKVVAKIKGRPALEHLLDRLRLSRYSGNIVLCTTEVRDDDILVEIARKNGIDWFRGSESDVMGRFIGAATRVGADTIVRITADNILIDPDYLDRAVAFHLKKKADYTRMRGLPSGVKSEVISTSALRKARRLALHPEYSEYMTWYFTKNKHVFKCFELRVKPGHYRPNVRLTLDEKRDLALLKAVFSNLYCAKSKPFGWDEIVRLIDSKPELFRMNAGVGHRRLSVVKHVDVRLRPCAE
jgi:spore coat polysaccharide biosynthesis protein SpsF